MLARPNRVTFIALCVLDDAADRAVTGADVSSIGLRLALAYLYAVGDRRGECFDREPYDGFWEAAKTRTAGDGGAIAFGRSQTLTAAFNGIARAAGMELDPALMSAMRKARGG